MAKVIDKLEDNRELAPLVWQAMETGLIRTTETSADCKLWFPKKVARVSSLPTEWIASWLLQRSEGKLTKGLLDLMDGHDAETLHQVFCAVTKTALSTPLPREMQHKPTCSRVFNKRADSVGDRLEHLSANVRKDGTVDWPKFGPYILVWQPGGGAFLHGVKHIEGDEVTPLLAHVVVSREFSLHLPWGDFDASLKLDSCSHSLAGLFQAGQGPNVEKPGRNGALLDSTAEEVAREMEIEQENAKKGLVADTEAEFLQTHDKKLTDQRKATLEAARTKLAASAKKRKSFHFST